MMNTLTNFIVNGKLTTPEHEIVTISAGVTDEEASQRIREVMRTLTSGRYGKKVLLKIEGKD
jgi:trans-2-enoyl-CoA reductase